MSTVCAAVFVGSTSCTKKSTTVERLAILPANLLISDPASEWLKTAVPIAIQYDLMTAHLFVSGVARDDAAAAQGGATRLLRTSIESRQGGLHIESTIVDAATQKLITVVSSDATSASVVLPAVNALAKKIDPNAIDFSTKITPAWQALATAETNSNPQQRAQFLNQAVSRDPSFGHAWVSLISMVPLNRQNELKGMIDDGKSHRASFSPFDQAKFDLALDRLSNAAPADQIQAALAVLKLAPNDLDVITTLGSYQILQGDSAAGEQALRRVVALNPANLLLRAELARGLLEMRKFKDADTVLSGIDKTTVYPELAAIVLLEGDKTRATSVIEKFIAGLPNEDAKTFVRADWQAISGDRQKGIEMVTGATFKDPNLQARALAEASLWQIMGGDYAGAQKTIAVISKIPSPQPSPLPVLFGLLADKTLSAADWQSKVETIEIPDAAKTLVLAYGFFLRGNFDEAAKTWQKVVDTSHGTDVRARAMLASSLDHAGRKADAQRINVLPFAPELGDLYSAVSFTEMRRLLAR